ncbi:MAG: CAP domain-containing protein [Hyphomonadaceae bacterium]|nr:CAP domain-containing protein [Hyphomonadaceae bacterium]
MGKLSLGLISIGLFCALSVSAHATSSAFPDDGTYKEITVRSFEACTALCEAEEKCRGAIAEQPDTRYEIMHCRLNNGFGANPAFPSIPPEPLNINIALADFNTYRQKNGLRPVILNDKLSAASKAHAEDLARHGNISHTGSDGSGHGDRVQRQGYYFSIAAENVATGQKSWEKVFKAWQDSPGHNENLLRDDVTEFGIALVYEPTTSFQTYWAMLVAAPFEEPRSPYTHYQIDPSN